MKVQIKSAIMGTVLDTGRSIKMIKNYDEWVKKYLQDRLVEAFQATNEQDSYVDLEDSYLEHAEWIHMGPNEGNIDDEDTDD